MPRRTNQFRGEDLAAGIADLGSAFLNFKAAQPRNQILRDRERLNNQIKEANLGLLNRRLNVFDQGEADRQAIRESTTGFNEAFRNVFTDPAGLPTRDVEVSVPQLDALADSPIGDIFAANAGATPSRTAALPAATTALAQDPITERRSETDLGAIQERLFLPAVQAISSSPDPVKTFQLINSVLESASLSPDPRVRRLAPSIKQALAASASADAKSNRKIREKALEQKGQFVFDAQLEKQKGLNKLAELDREYELKKTQGGKADVTLSKFLLEDAPGLIENFSLSEDAVGPVNAKAEELVRTQGLGPSEAYFEAIRQVTDIDPSVIGNDDLTLNKNSQIRWLRDGTVFRDFTNPDVPEGVVMVRATKPDGTPAKMLPGDFKKKFPEKFKKIADQFPGAGGGTGPSTTSKGGGSSNIPADIQSILNIIDQGAGVTPLDDPQEGLSDTVLQPVIDLITGKTSTEKRLRDEGRQQLFDEGRAAELQKIEDAFSTQINSLLESDLPEAEKRENIGGLFRSVLRDLERSKAIGGSKLGGSGRDVLSFATDINRLVQDPALLPEGATETAGGLPITPEAVALLNRLFSSASQQGFILPAQ